MWREAQPDSCSSLPRPRLAAARVASVRGVGGAAGQLEDVGEEEEPDAEAADGGCVE